MPSEQQYQAKIQKDLEKDGWYVIKLIKTNKNGISDILALKNGHTTKFIECKTLTGKLSKLQEFRLEEQKELGFDTYVSWGKEIKPY